MKLLPNISSKQYNDVEWVLKYLQDNPVIGDENVEPIENFHCFWKGVINDLHAVSLDSLFNTHPNAQVYLWVTDKFESSGSMSWINLKRKYKHRVKMVEITVDDFKDANCEVLFSNYKILTSGNPNLAQYNHDVAYASDIVRFVALYLHGGVWFDLDVLFLRSFDSIHLKRFVSQWGTGDCGNAAVLKLEKGHDLIDKILRKYTKPFYPTTTFKLENDLDLTILPSTFFDILWRPVEQIPEHIQFKTFDDFFKQTELNLPKEIYAYHWHNRWNNKPPLFYV
jgi:hypothetical protein